MRKLQSCNRWRAQEGSISRTGKESGSLGFNYGPPRIQKLKLGSFFWKMTSIHYVVANWLDKPLASGTPSGTPFEAAVRERSRTPESAGDCADDRAGDRAGDHAGDHAVIRLEVVIWFWAPILIRAIGTSAALAVGASCWR